MVAKVAAGLTELSVPRLPERRGRMGAMVAMMRRLEVARKMPQNLEQ